MKKRDSTNKKGIYLFWGTVMIALILFIGYDYVKLYFINRSPKYTVGTVTDFKEYVRSFNNKIEYFYVVKGKKYSDDYQSNRLPLHLKGKHILIKYAKLFPFWNVPFYDNILPDSLSAPPEGWNTTE